MDMFDKIYYTVMFVLFAIAFVVLTVVTIDYVDACRLAEEIL